MTDWRPIPNYFPYEVTSAGLLRNGKSKKLMNLVVSAKGYIRSYIWVNQKNICVTIHKLVLFAFVGPRPGNFQACHYDGCRSNNNLSNLGWVSAKENISHKKLHGTWFSGEKHPSAKFTAATAKEIRRIYVYRSKTHGGEALGKRYGVNPSTITRIASGRSYRIIPPALGR